jgi:hypothetical protein
MPAPPRGKTRASVPRLIPLNRVSTSTSSAAGPEIDFSNTTPSPGARTQNWRVGTMRVMSVSRLPFDRTCP